MFNKKKLFDFFDAYTIKTTVKEYIMKTVYRTFFLLFFSAFLSFSLTSCTVSGKIKEESLQEFLIEKGKILYYGKMEKKSVMGKISFDR